MINLLTDKMRQAMTRIAIVLDKATGSRVTPNFVTLLSFLGHLGVFLALIDEQYILAAGLIVVFGLMDALDGALARVQKVDSPAGMLLDASSDRAKEFLIYLGLTIAFAQNDNTTGVIASVSALGGSFMVSYIKAKGETAIASSSNAKRVNREFASGIMQYQVRMTVLIIGLLTGYIVFTATAIAVLAWITALVRLLNISESLQGGADD